MASDKPTTYCSGCKNDFYNGRQNVTTFGCWSLEDAKVVTRWHIDWCTAPTFPGAFRKMQTYDCHHAPGRYALYEKLPAFAVEPHDD